MTSTDHAATFHQLHQHGLLRLANAWDAGSARLVESLGAKAIATTSAGVAWANGYADGSYLPVQRLIDTAASIARVIRVPLSVDFEDGYASDPATVADNVARVIDAGAIGINIEDGADSPDLLAAKIEHIKRMAAERGVDLFVNARTDVYLRGLASEDRRVAETLARAKRYRDAGADGFFVPGLADADEIRSVVAEAGLPVNIMSRPDLPSAQELEALGVRRLSAGAAISISAMDYVAGLAGSFLQGTDATGKTLDYGSINALFDR
ncbi:isocitrate lyase/phosphoenolpyruvate mutase family protein [Lysobacter sp. F60174L2]|uniref:isocitrate lyase/phosphoenolpyruvate mutase family protein n=1 Tax=Lysobacter sp. F60174L2 TaxID=3459295 RepID=UPI00403E2FAD